MLPPWTSGGIVDSGPVVGATPITPQNGATRDADAGPELDPVGPGLEARDLVERVGEVVGEEAEAGDRGGPAPVGGLELEQLDLEGVARLGAVDRDGPGDLVDAVEVERGEVRARGLGVQLAEGGVEAVELDDLARPDRRHRLDRRVPDEVVLVARDVERRLGRAICAFYEHLGIPHTFGYADMGPAGKTSAAGPMCSGCESLPGRILGTRPRRRLGATREWVPRQRAAHGNSLSIDRRRHDRAVIGRPHGVGAVQRRELLPVRRSAHQARSRPPESPGMSTGSPRHCLLIGSNLR